MDKLTDPMNDLIKVIKCSRNYFLSTKNDKLNNILVITSQKKISTLNQKIFQTHEIREKYYFISRNESYIRLFRTEYKFE